MGNVRQKPPLIISGAELRRWRVEVGATQEQLAEVIGLASRTIVAYETGAHPIPQAFAWALVAVAPHVESLAKFKRRKNSQARRLREKRLRERRTRDRAAANRAVLKEAAQARRKELDEIRREHTRRQAQFFRVAEKFSKQHPPPPKPGADFIKPPKIKTVLGRRIRSDLGGSHNFRGRPGLKLRPKDIKHESP
jgi:DNA-binding XRE family transcriptional regulator